MSKWSDAHKYRSKNKQAKFMSKSENRQEHYTLIETLEDDWEINHPKKSPLWKFW